MKARFSSSRQLKVYDTKFKAKDPKIRIKNGYKDKHNYAWWLSTI